MNDSDNKKLTSTKNGGNATKQPTPKNVTKTAPEKKPAISKRASKTSTSVANKKAETKSAATKTTRAASKADTKTVAKRKPVKKATTTKKPAAKTATKKQSQPRLNIVTTDSGLDQVIDLNSKDLPTHPERIWPD